MLVIAPALAVRLGLRALLSTDQAIDVIGEAPALSGFDSLPSGADILVIAPSSGSDLDFQSVLPATASTGVLLLVEDSLPSGWELPSLHGRAWGLLPLDSSVEELAAAVHAVFEGLVVGLPALIEPLLESRPPAHGDRARTRWLIRSPTAKSRCCSCWPRGWRTNRSLPHWASASIPSNSMSQASIPAWGLPVAPRLSVWVSAWA